MDASKVKSARTDELNEFRNHTVYTLLPIKECFGKTGNEPIGTTWVDTNNGEAETGLQVQVGRSGDK